MGAIIIYRTEPGAFADKQLALLQTFADQAAIAIENVRLFDEIQDKKRARSRCGCARWRTDATGSSLPSRTPASA
jgi:GAF domain-containing protein